MGIIKLTKFFDEYIKSLPKTHQQIVSEICYIDYTANLVITTANISKKYLKYPYSSVPPIHDVCNHILDTCVNNIIEQVENNKYFKKYIIVFDYKYISKFNSRFQFDDNLLNDYILQLQFEKDHIDAIPMIPKNLDFHTTPITILKESVRNMYELRLKGCISEYQNLYILLQQVENESKLDTDADLSKYENEKTILQSIINFGLYRYIVLRGAKNNTRRDRGIKRMCKTIHSHKSILESKELGNILDNINVRLYSSLYSSHQNFKNTLNNFKNTINYTLIVNLIPILVSKIKSEIKARKINTQIDFIGCENESDFVIRKHILLYNSLNCPTIYTTDSDLFMLLADVNCYIRIKSSSLNIRIKPNLFWQWLTGLKNIYLNDIIAFCCVLGNDYNHFKFTKYKVDTLNDIRELFKNNKNLYANVYNHAIKLYKKYKSRYLTKEIDLSDLEREFKPEIQEQPETEAKDLISHKQQRPIIRMQPSINELLHFIISLDMYKQCDLIENEIHYIAVVNRNTFDKIIDETIEMKYRNIFTDNF